MRDLSADSVLCTNPGLCLVYAEQPHEAIEGFTGMLSDAQNRGSLFGASALLSLAALHHGDILTAEAHGRYAWDALAQLDPAPGTVLLALAAGRLYAAALRERDRLQEAQKVTDSMLAFPGMGDLTKVVVRGYLLYATGCQHLASGRLDHAQRGLAMVGDLMGGSEGWDPDRPWRAKLAMACALAGRYDEAAHLAERQLHGAERWGTPSAIGSALLLCGLVGPSGPDIPTLEHAVSC